MSNPNYPGNPETDPTWALVHEQRTANLIAKLRFNVELASSRISPNDEFLAVDQEILDRLGLEGES